MRIARSIGIMALGLALSGCGKSGVNSVKDAYLTGWEQTTVGNAFEAFFAEPKWELDESANKTKFVEFTGKMKKDLVVDDGEMFPRVLPYGEPGFSGENLYMIPKGGKVVVQFIIKKDGSFSVGYGGASVKINPNLDQASRVRFEFVYELGSLPKALKTDGSIVSMTKTGISRFLHVIYAQ